METAFDRDWLMNMDAVRQGDCLFIPEPFLFVDSDEVLPHEPLVRTNGGKGHRAEFAWRGGGEMAYVSNRHPAGLSIAQFTQLYGRVSPAKFGFRVVARQEEVFVRGRISHPDHRSIRLHGWHRVVMHPENPAAAMRHVMFLD